MAEQELFSQQINSKYGLILDLLTPELCELMCDILLLGEQHEFIGGWLFEHHGGLDILHK